MDLSAALADDLGLLSAAIRDSGGDLAAWLRSFVDEMQGAIGSYLGLTMKMSVDGNEISFTLTDGATVAGTSLSVPLPVVAASEIGSALVLYASAPGAFVDLAADLAWALALKPSTLVLDKHLAVPGPSNAVIGLPEQATINRAVGALIDRGHTSQSARIALGRHAVSEGGSVYESAEWVLTGICRQPLAEGA